MPTWIPKPEHIWQLIKSILTLTVTLSVIAIPIVSSFTMVFAPSILANAGLAIGLWVAAAGLAIAPWILPVVGTVAAVAATAAVVYGLFKGFQLIRNWLQSKPATPTPAVPAAAATPAHPITASVSSSAISPSATYSTAASAFSTTLAPHASTTTTAAHHPPTDSSLLPSTHSLSDKDHNDESFDPSI